MKPFYVTVSFRMIIGRAPMNDSEPVQGFDESRGSELRSVVGGQGHAGIAGSLRQTREHDLPTSPPPAWLCSLRHDLSCLGELHRSSLPHDVFQDFDLQR